MRHFDPVSLRLFVSVCEERNIALAAEREAIVPSAISKRISALEEQLGVQLFKRGRRGVVITPAGEALLRYARELLQYMERMHGELSEFAHGVHGHVRVVASLSAMVEFLPDDISAFVQRYEKVRVRLDEKISSEIVRGVEEGRADVGICWNASNLHSLESIPYHSDHLAVVVPRAHALAASQGVSFEETLDFEHVDIQPGSIVQLMLQRHATAAGKTMRYRIQVATFDTACRIVAANLAIAIVPQEVAATFEHSLGLQAIPLTNAWAHRQFVICVKGYAALSNPVRLLVDTLSASASTRPPIMRADSV